MFDKNFTARITLRNMVIGKLPAFHDKFSDQKYAEKLQLQEALLSSKFQINASISPSSSSPALHDKDEIISDEKYAEELQLQEALLSSKLQINASISSSSPQKDASSTSSSSSSSQNDASSSTPSLALTMNQTMVTSESSESFCDICMDTKSSSEMFSNATVCGHLFCSDCICGHVSTKIKENIMMVKCPDPECKGVIGPELCRSIVPKEVLERWEDALCESLILGTQKFYCPFKDCSAMLVDDSRNAVTSSECPNYNRLFCAQCKVAWHSGLDCKGYKSLKEDERNPEGMMLMELAKNKKWKRCPSCNFVVEKKDGCHRISCRCGNHFCYGCGKKHAPPSYACNM